ncbi:MAG: hypothetical protein F6K35_46790 [Okeania sp. SIO2H7]|nr:hypothetical protein [Okeania sp. SIO2H7]
MVGNDGHGFGGAIAKDDSSIAKATRLISLRVPVGEERSHFSLGHFFDRDTPYFGPVRSGSI